MIFPVDYTPAWWPHEDVACAMVQAQLDRCDPGGIACTRINKKDAETAIAAGKVIVRVHARPGVVDRRIRTTPIELEVLSAKRDTSYRTLEFLSDVLCSTFGSGSDLTLAGETLKVHAFEIDETQQQVVFIDPDERMVHASFLLRTGKRTAK